MIETVYCLKLYLNHPIFKVAIFWYHLCNEIYATISETSYKTATMLLRKALENIKFQQKIIKTLHS